MQRVWVLNGDNITYDHDLAMLFLWITDWWVVEWWDISNSKIQPLKAAIPCLRTNGQKLLLSFESDEQIDISSVEWKIYVEVSQNAIDDWEENNENWTWIAQITIWNNWPTKNFVKLYSISSWVITDERHIEPKLSEINWLKTRMTQAEADIAELQVAWAADHLEDRVLVWTSYTLDDLMFKQFTPKYENATNTLNVWDVAANTEVHVQRLWSWTASNKLKMKIKMWWSPTTSLIVEVRKWIKVIDDAWESHRYWDSNNVIASASVPYTTFSSSWQDLEITLDNNFWWTEWELLDVVLYQNSHIVNASNYYVIWIDSTQESDAFQALKVNWSTVKTTFKMPYCISDWFADVVWERVSDQWAYAKPRVLKEIWEITRLTTLWRHIDWTWLDHASEDTIDYKPQRYKTITCYINESQSDPSQMVSLWDDCSDWTSSDFDAFFNIRPVLLASDWTVFKELNKSDFTKDVWWNSVSSYLDWTSWTYNAMVEFPRRWIKMSKSSNTITIQMTDNPWAYDDWFHYYAHTRWPVDLSSNDTATAETTYAKNNFYLWIYKWYVKDWKLRSITWQIPTTTIYIYDARTNARANWTWFEQSGFYQLLFRQIMYVFKYQNLNSQATLWRWFVDKTSWRSSTSCYSWATNSKWMDWWNTSSWTDTTENRVKLFWIEDPWWNVWEWIDWLNINNYNAYASTDADNRVHDSTSTPYYNVWSLYSTSDKYITKALWTTKWWFLPSSAWWTDSTYYCDNEWINSGSRVAASGAVRIDASGAGVFVVSLSDASSDRDAYVGARLMFL